MLSQVSGDQLCPSELNPSVLIPKERKMYTDCFAQVSNSIINNCAQQLEEHMISKVESKMTFEWVTVFPFTPQQEALGHLYAILNSFHPVLSI